MSYDPYKNERGPTMLECEGLNEQPPVFKIRNDLVEAYKGYFGDEKETLDPYNEYVVKEGRKGEVAVEAYEDWLDTWVRQKILSHTPKARLDIYLEWNGIQGYVETVYDIATGKLS